MGKKMIWKSELHLLLWAESGVWDDVGVGGDWLSQESETYAWSDVSARNPAVAHPCCPPVPVLAVQGQSR